jgi:hypothetical protein
LAEAVVLCRDRISIDNGYTPLSTSISRLLFPPPISFDISSTHDVYVARMTFGLARRRVGLADASRLARCADRDLPNGMSGTLIFSGCRLGRAAAVSGSVPHAAGLRATVSDGKGLFEPKTTV